MASVVAVVIAVLGMAMVLGAVGVVARGIRIEDHGILAGKAPGRRSRSARRATGYVRVA